MVQPNSILQGDCLELMKDIPDKSIDMILCDLPYGTTKCFWDIVIPFEPLWLQYKRIIKDTGAIVLFGSQPFTTDLIMSNRKMYKYELIWQKSVPTGMAQSSYMPMKYHENICVFYKNLPIFNKIFSERAESAKNRAKSPLSGSSNKSNHVNLGKQTPKQYDPLWVNPKSIIEIKSVPNSGGYKLHPTQKPVKLFEYLIKTYTNEGDLVLDNCAGSGTTGIACINTKRDYILMELDESYYKLINKRIKNHTREKPLI